MKRLKWIILKEKNFGSKGKILKKIFLHMPLFVFPYKFS